MDAARALAFDRRYPNVSQPRRSSRHCHPTAIFLTLLGRVERREWRVRHRVSKQMAEPLPAFPLANAHSQDVARSVGEIPRYILFVSVVPLTELRLVELHRLV